MTSGSRGEPGVDLAPGGRPQVLTPRARALLPIFLVVLVTLAVRQLYCALPDRLVLTGPTMGTTWSVVLAAAGRPREDAERARDAIEAQLETVNGRMSTWDPESELSRLNRDTSSVPVSLSPETFEVMALARRVSERTGGAFDVTVGPLVAAWGFGAGARAPGRGPDAQELAALRERVGFEGLELEPDTRTVLKRRPDLQADLSAIAKGYAADRVASALAELDWADFMVEIGGEVVARGERPGGGAWRVGIERPDPAQGRIVQGVVELRDLGMATSGDYRNFYELDGERLSHILDPRTGRPVRNRVASVSVVHPSAARADAWATALMVVGADEGVALAEAEGLGAYFLLRSAGDAFEVRTTRGFPEVR